MLDGSRRAAASADPAPSNGNAGDLYEAYSNQIYGFCLRRLRNREEARDAVQDTFLNAHRCLLRGFEPDRPLDWLIAIARNLCASRYRTRVASGQLEQLDAFELRAAEIPDVDVFGLATAIAQLPQPQQSAFVLRELRGLSYPEIADELGLSYASVAAHIFRARRELKASLGGDRPAVRRPARGISAGSFVVGLKALLGAGATQTAAALVVATSMTLAVPLSAPDVIGELVAPAPAARPKPVIPATGEPELARVLANVSVLSRLWLSPASLAGGDETPSSTGLRDREDSREGSLPVTVSASDGEAASEATDGLNPVPVTEELAPVEGLSGGASAFPAEAASVAIGDPSGSPSPSTRPVEAVISTQRPQPDEVAAVENGEPQLHGEGQLANDSHPEGSDNTPPGSEDRPPEPAQSGSGQAVMPPAHGSAAFGQPTIRSDPGSARPQQETPHPHQDDPPGQQLNPPGPKDPPRHSNLPAQHDTPATQAPGLNGIPPGRVGPPANTHGPPDEAHGPPDETHGPPDETPPRPATVEPTRRRTKAAMCPGTAAIGWARAVPRRVTRVSLTRPAAMLATHRGTAPTRPAKSTTTRRAKGDICLASRAIMRRRRRRPKKAPKSLRNEGPWRADSQLARAKRRRIRITATHARITAKRQSNADG